MIKKNAQIGSFKALNDNVSLEGSRSLDNHGSMEVEHARFQLVPLRSRPVVAAQIPPSNQIGNAIVEQISRNQDGNFTGVVHLEGYKTTVLKLTWLLEISELVGFDYLFTKKKETGVVADSAQGQSLN
ncbi:hypothetical protein CUMW_263920 [Citrus unshiu]|uniref:Uncharacterized protein n=1 Tax=Citrus unshiu TaxID=55188 RepID=A0A2H5QV13_CITUN|nr:hypothetical protein CUMW_263920 [Citrus unshiu]